MHITVRHLAKAYGALWALRDVNLDLPSGECVALLGPNGAGKTTLLKLLAGLLSPTAGDIAFDGDHFRGNDARHRSVIGFLTPGEHLYENLTVRENLLFFASLYKQHGGVSRIDAALDQVALRQRSEEYVANLSSGMKCRLAIAKWQLIDPGILLLDEPYGVLDGSGVDLLEGFVRAQLKKGSVVIVASHHVPRALGLCTRALILHQGRLTFDEKRQQPWPNLTRAFVEFMPHGEPWNS